ncbi:MAG: hypothetical protein MJ200_04870 [Mycoplasmoidaceae bacterium]|nr:hypothetical protein [Mycoplasmoidaceae bacterium]
MGVSLTENYRGPVDAGQTYSFDNDKKCYTATYVKEGKTITISFYFLNKKLIKYDRVITSDVTGVQHEIADFTYHNTTPQLPIPEYDQEVKLTYIPETLDDWECLVGPSGKIPALTYKVVADFSQWQGAKEDIFIFYITQNSG